MFEHTTRISGLANLGVVALLAVALTACTSAGTGSRAGKTQDDADAVARSAAGPSVAKASAQDLAEQASQRRNSDTVVIQDSGLTGTHPGGHGPQR